MNAFARLFLTELRLFARETQGGYLIFLAQRLVWPALAFAIQVFGYSPFLSEPLQRLTGGLSVPLFTLASIWTLSFFLEYVGTGFRLGLRRDWALLELVYASPFSRMGWLLAVTAAQGMGAYVIHLPFLVLASLLAGLPISLAPGPDLPTLLGTTLVVALASIPWGMFICAVFLLGRNSRFFYALFETPAEFFSGSRFPLGILPAGLASAGVLYPLAQSTLMLRETMSGSHALLRTVLAMAATALLYLGAALACARVAERRALRKGDLSYS